MLRIRRSNRAPRQDRDESFICFYLVFQAWFVGVPADGQESQEGTPGGGKVPARRLSWKLGLWRSGRGLRERCKSRRGLRVGCESLDLFDPVGEVGDVGEDAGVDGMSAVKTPAGQPHQNPGTGEVTDEGAPGIALGKKWEFRWVTEPGLRRPGSKVGLMSLCPPASLGWDSCEIPSTSIPL